MASNSGDRLSETLRDTMISICRRDQRDLTSRQLGVFLTCYLEDSDHTVRGLAAELNVAKPAITRALDRLATQDFIRRAQDPRDHRSVLVKRTAKGAAFLRELRALVAKADTATLKRGTASR